jgi:predicted 3-demethylubiquinone-9 3-methyltransferase (glyoxalase superfamily)
LHPFVKDSDASQEFILLNGGPHFKFTEAISFMVNCESQEEVDRYSQELTAGGGQESQCG